MGLERKPVPGNGAKDKTMKKLRKKELDKMQKQLGISSRKSIEERGRFPRPAVFKDKKKDARKYAARKMYAYA